MNKREEVYLNCFNHYIDKNDSKKARQFKDLLIRNSKKDSLKTYVQRVYDVKIEHESKYLDEMLKDVTATPFCHKSDMLNCQCLI